MNIGSDNFYQSDIVSGKRVSFHNQYRMNIVGTLFIPQNTAPNTRYPALVVGHPMGAVKEQSATLYATKMAEQGYVTLAVDLPFWGESDGATRNLVSPDLYAETFSAAVDFLGSQSYIDPQRIGGIGICGSGGFLISAAKIDPRLKAIATVSMYDMGAATRHGLGNSITREQRQQMIHDAAAQRDMEFSGGATRYTGGSVHEITPDSHPIAVEFFDFYRTARGEYTPAGSSPELTTHPTLSSNVRFLNFYPFNDIDTISPRPMLFIAGEKAHSIEFSEQAYALAAEPKQLLLVPGAGHVDLYDGVNIIPWDSMNHFFDTHLQ